MSTRFQELAWKDTPIGEISLRRRRDPALGVEVYEVKLGDEFLMSSLFTVAEIELATLGLAALDGGPLAGDRLDVVVGGLGLGYTARAVLADPRVASLTVVEALDEVIDWHRRGLLPLAAELTGDPRTALRHGDFFDLIATGADLRPAAGTEPASGSAPDRFHAVLVDIDHSPSRPLHPGHAPFYRPDGLRRLADRLHPGGVFALWSNDPPEEEFTAVLADVFAAATAHVVTFDNPLQRRTSTNTVYLAVRR